MLLSGPNVELTETLESRTSFSGPSVELAETLEVGLEVRLVLDTRIASVLMVCVAPPVEDSETKLLEFSTPFKPS